MFTRASTLLSSVVALAGVVIAAPSVLDVRTVVSSECSTGTLQCCSSFQSSDTEFINQLFGSFRLPLPAAGTQVGFMCSPVTVAGSGPGAFCNHVNGISTGCCYGNSFNGITTGCFPITIHWSSPSP